jgi:hypothetical protein
LVIVTTAPKARWDQVMASRPPETEIEADVGADRFAARAVQTLVDSARPHRVGYERDRYNRGLVPFSDAQGSQRRSWDPITWRLGGMGGMGGMFRFAHAWTAITIDDPERYVGVAAYRTPERSLDLVEVAGHVYGLDFTQSFSIDDLSNQPNRLGIDAFIRALSVHPDHLRVVEDGAQQHR